MLETRSVRRGWTRSLGLAGAGRFGGRDLLGIVARGMSRSLGEEKTGWRIHRLKKKSRIHRIHISTLQQVSEMEAFVDLKVAGGDLLEDPGSEFVAHPQAFLLERKPDADELARHRKATCSTREKLAVTDTPKKLILNRKTCRHQEVVWLLAVPSAGGLSGAT